jgi:hypothetical protein
MIDSYKSVNHFKNQLRYYKGQIRDNIPDEIYQMIHEEVENNNLSINNLNYHRLVGLLRQHGYHNYCKLALSILIILKYGQSIIITPDMETELCLLFEQICSIRNKLTNNNFLYPTILYQLCKLKNITAVTDFLSTNSIVFPNRKYPKWNEICKILSTEQEIELKNHINTKITPLLSIMLNLQYNHILENISHYIYILTKNNMIWIRAFNNLE